MSFKIQPISIRKNIFLALLISITLLMMSFFAVEYIPDQEQMKPQLPWGLSSGLSLNAISMEMEKRNSQLLFLQTNVGYVIHSSNEGFGIRGAGLFSYNASEFRMSHVVPDSQKGIKFRPSDRVWNQWAWKFSTDNNFGNTIFNKKPMDLISSLNKGFTVDISSISNSIVLLSTGKSVIREAEKPLTI